jgi:predicted small metal-binding protein
LLVPVVCRGEVREMAYSVQCRDAGVDCPGSFTTESKEELVKHVELHAKEAHPGLELEPEQVEQLIKTTA